MLVARAMTAIPSNNLQTPLPGERLLPAGGRVLLVRLSALGDVLFALETVAALRRERPDVHVDFLVEDRFQSLLAGHPQIDRVLVYPRKSWLAIPRSLLAMRRRRYDVILDVHGILKSALHVIVARGKTKVGASAPASREGAARAYGLVVPMPTPVPHRADIGHHLLRAIGLSGQPTAPVLNTPPAPPDLLAGLPAPRILLHPGTSAFAVFKRWPGEHFAELARALRDRGHSVLVGFGPGERALAEPLLAKAPGSRAVDGASLGLLGLAGVMRECAVVVAADTGPLHLAAAVSVPTVALFGPKDPARYGPRSHGNVRHAILWHDVPCRPCRRRTCVSPQCVLGIRTDDVLAAVLRQLAARGSP
jgi:ADP-heptose:LPS heptosyltransferase